MKKLITYVTAASLLMGSMCTTAYGVTFADINTVTWSGFIPFIEEAAELGLMSGYLEDGKRYCKPRNNVTYCETVQLMYSIMRAYTKQDISDDAVMRWKLVMSGLDIPEWAYKATAYALEKDVLTSDDLTKLANGTKYANREDVGVIFAKALDTINGYDVKENPSLSYLDKAQVSDEAVPYLELLYRENLMVGDTDNKFNPKANISRAEMAVLSVKAYHKLLEKADDATQEKTIEATVISTRIMANGDLFLTLKNEDDAGLNLFAELGTVKPVYLGVQIGFDDIGVNDSLKITYQGDQIKSMEVLYSAEGVLTMETYEMADISSSKITVLKGTAEEEFPIDNNVIVKLEGKNSTVSKVKTAADTAKYDVILIMDKEGYVLSLSAMLNENNPTEGQVADVDDASITLLVGAREYTYPLAYEPDIEYNGKTVRFTKLLEEYDDYNYYVSLKLNQEYEVDEIQIEYMEDDYSGTLQRLTSKVMELSAGGTVYEYSLADDVTVTIDGTKSSVDELKSSYRYDDKVYTVTVELNRYDEVTSITAVSRYGSNSGGALKNIGTDTLTIIVDEKEYTYDLASDVTAEINDKSCSISELKEYTATYEFNVDLSFNSSGEVSGIKASMKSVPSGELRYISEKDGIIAIRAAGTTIELELAEDAAATLGGKEISLTALDAELNYAFGSSMDIELEFDRSGKVDVITAHWIDVSGDLIAVYDNEDEICVKVDGNNKDYVVDLTAEFEYVLSAGAEKDDYESRYDKDLDGLKDFLYDAANAGNTCKVDLTREGGRIVWIKATAGY